MLRQWNLCQDERVCMVRTICALENRIVLTPLFSAVPCGKMIRLVQSSFRMLKLSWKQAVDVHFLLRTNVDLRVSDRWNRELDRRPRRVAGGIHIAVIEFLADIDCVVGAKNRRTGLGVMVRLQSPNDPIGL